MFCLVITLLKYIIFKKICAILSICNHINLGAYFLVLFFNYLLNNVIYFTYFDLKLLILIWFKYM